MYRTISKYLALLRFPSIEEQERAYLEAAVDHFDLEARERQIDRGLFRQQRLAPSAWPAAR